MYANLNTNFSFSSSIKYVSQSKGFELVTSQISSLIYIYVLSIRFWLRQELKKCLICPAFSLSHV